jgi:glycosyltransferase involved in cell wall biosynthesis
VPVKNYPLLLRTFALLHAKNDQVRLVLIGQGPDEDALRNLACKLGISDNVHFIVGQKAYGYYPLFDVFVQSSDKEGISIALLEAMSAGVPCIVTNRNDFHAVIKHGYNGLLVAHNNAYLLAIALEKIIHDQKLRSHLVKNAYEVLEKNFDQHKMISAYQQLYEAPREISI